MNMSSLDDKVDLVSDLLLLLLMFKIMKSGFYYTNPKRKKSIKPLNLSSKKYYYIFGVKMAIIIMVLFPMIFLCIHQCFVFLQLFQGVSKSEYRQSAEKCIPDRVGLLAKPRQLPVSGSDHRKS